MRVILFLSRFTFICNIAFLVFVFFSWVEKTNVVKVPADRVLEIPFAKELIIILGFSAFFINLILGLIYLIISVSGKIIALPRWLVVANIVFLFIQFCYFFLL